MKRRALLTLGAGAAAFVFAGRRPALAIRAGGHEGAAEQRPFGPKLADLNPDRMWPVYRRYHLLIVSQRDVPNDLQIPALDDRFHLGSNTKAMTALLAAILVEEGALRWDSSMAEVFPETARYDLCCTIRLASKHALIAEKAEGHHAHLVSIPNGVDRRNQHPDGQSEGDDRYAEPADPRLGRHGKSSFRDRRHSIRSSAA